MKIDLDLIEKIKTPEDVEREAKVSEAKRTLAETDWYAFAFMEEGTVIPKDIQKLRNDARAVIKESQNATE